MMSVLAVAFQCSPSLGGGCEGPEPTFSPEVARTTQADAFTPRPQAAHQFAGPRSPFQIHGRVSGAWLFLLSPKAEGVFSVSPQRGPGCTFPQRLHLEGDLRPNHRMSVLSRKNKKAAAFAIVLNEVNPSFGLMRSQMERSETAVVWHGWFG